VPRSPSRRDESIPAGGEAGASVHHPSCVEHPLSRGQRALWLLHQLDPESSAYNVYLAMWIRSLVDVAALHRSFQCIVDRHTPLRSTFVAKEGKPIQRIAPRMPVEFSSRSVPDIGSAELLRLVRDEAQAPFDLERGPVFRVALFSRSPEEHVLLINSHHIVTDMWSTVVLMEELGVLYPAQCEGSRVKLPPLAAEYADFVRWQQEMVSGDEGEAHWQFWKEALSGRLPILQLPTDRPRPLLQTYRGSGVKLRIGEAVTRKLKELARAEKVTLFTLLVAAFQTLLHRYSGQREILIGAPAGARPRSDFERIVGYFVNPVVLRADFKGDPPFREFLQRARREVVDALEHQDYPFPLLVERLQPGRDPGRSPLFQVMFSFERPHRSEARGSPAFLFGEEGTRRSLAGLDMEPLLLELKGSQFDLTLAVHEAGESLNANFEYNTDLFDPSTIDRMSSHFRELLGSIVAGPSSKVSALPLLTDRERRLVIHNFSGSAVPSSWPGPIHERIREMARLRPETAAVQVGPQKMIYAELEVQAERLAARLKALGVARGAVVGLLATRSLESILGILAVLKAGGACLSLDPASPPARLRFLIEDARPVLILASENHRSRLPDVVTPILDLRREEAMGPSEVNSLTGTAGPEDPAYVVYTSGSTGVPKGVILPHRALANHAVAVMQRYRLGPGDRVLQFASLSFDVSVEEILPTLMSGATIVPRSLEAAPSVDEFIRFLTDQRITVANLPASFWHQWVSELGEGSPLPPDLRLLIVGSEKVRSECLARWGGIMGTRVRLLNAYGPSETTITATLYDPQESAGDTRSLHEGGEEGGAGEASGRDAMQVSIGRPLPGVRLYVLDSQGKPAPIGVPGEAYIGGAGVALGYLNRPEISAQKFVPDPFTGETGSRLYRTGDRVRWRHDGNLEILGRLDDQVKIRGVRIEPGEIESALSRHPAVKDAVVAVRSDAKGRERLVAYFIAASPGRDDGSESTALHGPSGGELRSFLKERLPEVMIPSAFVGVDDWPRTPGGKLDRLALAELQEDGPSSAVDSAPPRSSLEETLARIWAEVLDLPRVGREDNFFSLGGDSILGIQVVARARQLGVPLSTRQFFLDPTVAGLAASAAAAAGARHEQGPVEGEAPLSPIQRWFFAQASPEPHHDNQAVLLRLREPADVSALEEALARILDHHDALRLRFRKTPEGWTQRFSSPGGESPLLRFDLSKGSPAARSSLLHVTAAGIQSSLDLASGPNFRAALFDMGSGETPRLLLTAHHLVVDGVSWRILLEDLATVYESLRRGTSPVLPAKSTSFKIWTERLVEHARTAAILREASFWLDLLETPTRPLPCDRAAERRAFRRKAIRPRRMNREASARTVTFGLSEEETRALLRRAPEAYGSRIDELLLAALDGARVDGSGSGAWLVDLEGHGREDLFDDVDLSRTVGWFTTLYPVPIGGTASGGASDPVSRVSRAGRMLRSIPGRGLGYGLLRYLGDDRVCRELESLAQAEICFNYLGQLDQSLPPNAPFEFAGEPLGVFRSPRARRSHVFEVNAMVVGGRLEIQWTYSADLHRRSSVERIARSYLNELRAQVEGIPSRVWMGGGEVALLSAETGVSARSRVGGIDSDIEDAYPLSPMQQGMLFHTLSDIDPGAYVEQMTWTFEAGLNEAAFEAAWGKLAARHQPLRAAIAWEGLDEPLQLVRREVSMPLSKIDWRGLEAIEQERRFEEALRDDRGREFDLTRAPLMRCTLVRVSEERYRFIWSHHHLILDGWSLPVLLGELAEIYEALTTGREPALGPVPPYRNFIDYLRGKDGSREESFWRRSLEGFRVSTPLPLPPPRPNATTAAVDGGEALDSVYALQRGRLSLEAGSALEAFARRHALTLGTLFRAAWAIVLGRYTGKADVVFGSVVSGRPADLAGSESMVGLLINTLPLRVRLQDKEPLLGWLKKIQSDQFELLSHEHTPLVQIQGWSEIPAGRPLFESILIFENYPMGRQLGERFERLKITDVKAWDKTNYPINLAVSPGSPISLEVVYDRRRFEAASITRLLGHLATLLEAMPADPDRRLGDLPLLSALEQRRLSQEWGGADGGKSRTASREASSPPSAPTIQALVKEQAARDGNRTAVAYEHRNLTYCELDWLSDALAARLEQMGVGGGFLVAVCMERSPEAIVGMLGVLKAGAAYLPLDPAYPKERIQFMLEDSGAAVILTQKPLLGKVPGRGLPVLCLDEPKGFAPNEDAKRSESRPAREKDPLAYVMYTSGSTGRPKGIQVTHRGLVRLLRNADPIRYAADDVVLQAVSHSFDPSALEIWGCLANGGRLVLLPSRTPTLEEIGEALVANRATSLILITGLFPLMVEERLGDLKGLRQLIVGGDVMPPAAARRLLQAFPGIRLINAYGPTEGTIVACSHLMTDPSEIMHTIPIGRPAAETRVYLLDRAMRQVPAGIPGELYIGGEGVARGYHRRPDLTAERFVPDRFDDGPGARLYRTGDLARWRSDGKLEFLGRADQQVKIRGYRIEPGEVETVLGLHPDVRECAVVPQAGIAGERRLVAYVVSSGRGALSTGDLRDFLKGKLPEFMLPAAFVMVERFSLTPNGKVDRAALPPPESAGWKARSERVPPRTPCEAEVASIWAEVLEKESPGVEDDFFEAGGHSLLATKLISRLRGRFGPLVSLRDLYDTPTIRGLAALLETTVPQGKEDEPRSGEGKTPRRGDGVVPPGTDTGPLRPMVGRGEAP